jgi:hypothetical protein
MNPLAAVDRGASRRGRRLAGMVMANWLGVIVPVAIGLLFTVVGLPLARRRVPRNGWYGYRIRATLRDDEIWYAVNERGGRHLILLGAILVLLGLLGLIFVGQDRTQEDLAILAAAIALVGIGYSAWLCLAMARELDRARRVRGS